MPDKASSRVFTISILVALVTLISLAVLGIYTLSNPILEERHPTAPDIGRNSLEIGLTGFLTSILLYWYHIKKDRGFFYLAIAFSLLFLLHFVDIFRTYALFQWASATGNYTHFRNVYAAVSMVRQTLQFIFYPLAVWLSLFGITSLLGYSKGILRSLVYVSVVVICSGLLPWFQFGGDGGSLFISVTWTAPIVSSFPETIDIVVNYPLLYIYYLMILSSTSLLSASVLDGKVRRLLTVAGGFGSLISAVYFLISLFNEEAQAVLIIGDPSIGPIICLVGSLLSFYVLLRKASEGS